MSFHWPIRVYWEDTDTSVLQVSTEHMRDASLWTCTSSNLKFQSSRHYLLSSS